MIAAATIETAATIAAVRRDLAQQFRLAGLDTPELDARLLVGHALGLDHAALVARANDMLSVNNADAIAALAERRLAREPVARILGVKEFWGLPLRLNSETLVPRPESETVVEAALTILTAEAKLRPLRIVDLGTGSGALALALLTELPAARAVCTDVSPTALGCARANAVALKLSARCSFVACDYGAALGGGFDLVVCNPPYISVDDIATLAPEVRRFDPLRALDGGADGLTAYRAIAADATRLLAPRGAMVVELGAGQFKAVNDLFEARGLVAVGHVRHDLAGIARALVVRSLP